jgi:hypothetical protein
VDVWHFDEHDDGRCRVKGRTVAVDPRFVDSAPGILEPGVMYVSIRHKTVLHLCACGCGHEVVTPLAPHRWRLVFDGETVSLEPSVSNGVLACRSHYFITRNMIDWRRPMTEAGIEWARSRDARALARASAADNNPDDDLANHTQSKLDDNPWSDPHQHPYGHLPLDGSPVANGGASEPEVLRGGRLSRAARRCAAAFRWRAGRSS